MVYHFPFVLEVEVLRRIDNVRVSTHPMISLCSVSDAEIETFIQRFLGAAILTTFHEITRRRAISLASIDPA